MKRFFSIIKICFRWLPCVILFPFALMGLFFKVSYIIYPVVLFVFIRYLVPMLFKKIPRAPGWLTILLCELLLAVMGGRYYVTDHRADECRFPFDGRITPILTYKQCIEDDGGDAEKKACLKILDNPYDITIYRGSLLVVSGRDYSTLGIIEPRKGGRFQAIDLGYGNIQRVVPDEERGLAVFPMWKDRKIVLYDLEERKPVRIFNTKVSKLIEADKDGDNIYVVSEMPFIYEINYAAREINEFDLGYQFHTLYDIRIDHSRGNIFLSDWVWAFVYKLDLETKKTEKSRRLGIVSAGMTLDEDVCELYVTRVLNSRVDVLDCGTLETKRKLSAGFGVHEVVKAGKKKNLFALRYFAGKIKEMDPVSGETIYEGCVGSQPRALYYWEDENRLFTASRCGIFEIRI